MSPVLSAKGWSPKGRKGKENTLSVGQQVGFQPGLQLNALTTLPQCHSKMGSSACVGQKVQKKKRICYFAFVTSVATVDITIVPCDASYGQYNTHGLEYT